MTKGLKRPITKRIGHSPHPFPGGAGKLSELCLCRCPPGVCDSVFREVSLLSLVWGSDPGSFLPALGLHPDSTRPFPRPQQGSGGGVCSRRVWHLTSDEETRTHPCRTLQLCPGWSARGEGRRILTLGSWGPRSWGPVISPNPDEASRVPLWRWRYAARSMTTTSSRRQL